MSKVKTIAEIKPLLDAAREAGRKIVHCHGVFDLLHIGHIRYFEQARQMGDLLLVTLTPDRFVDKGPGRPAFGEDLRAESIASLDSVDYVVINQWPTAEETLRALRPDIYVKGQEFRDVSSDPTGKMGLEAAVVKEIGAELAFAGDIVFSSSNLINRYFSQQPDELKSYLELFRQRASIEGINALFERMAGLKVLVVGDAILDAYQYCDTIGKSSKDPTLAMKFRSEDLFAGGVFAVANHVAGFVDQVDLLTVIGEVNSREEFIRAQLRDNVNPTFFVQPGAPTLTKRRFIDAYALNKLLEIYEMDDSGLPQKQADAFNNWLRERIKDYDLVIVSDFGHGTINDDSVRLLQKASFLAVNTQANAGNRGFNTIGRYPGADFGCLAEHELRLEYRVVRGDIRPYLYHLVGRLGASRFIVTQGRRGCEVCSARGEFVKVPSFARNTVDRVGAGDAFFSVAALAAMLDAPDEMIGFVGSIAGSLAVEIIGNEKSIDRSAAQKFITALLK